MEILEELKWPILILIVLGLLWFVSDGYERSKKEKIFIEPPPPISEGRTYGFEDINKNK